MSSEGLVGKGFVGDGRIMGDGGNDGIVSGKVAVGGDTLGLVDKESVLTHGFVVLSSPGPRYSGGMMDLPYPWYGGQDGCYGPWILRSWACAAFGILSQYDWLYVYYPKGPSVLLIRNP